jgi:hypothetical protein
MIREVDLQASTPFQNRSILNAIQKSNRASDGLFGHVQQRLTSSRTRHRGRCDRLETPGRYPTLPEAILASRATEQHNNRHGLSDEVVGIFHGNLVARLGLHGIDGPELAKPQ